MGIEGRFELRIPEDLKDWLEDYAAERRAKSSRVVRVLLDALRDGRISLPELELEPTAHGAHHPIQESPMEIHVIVNGTPLRSVHHAGQQFVEAPATGEYMICVTNTDYRNRQLAVVSVDGINVVDGKNAAFDGAGYVLGRHGTSGDSVDIRGWRRGNERVAAFTFEAAGESYAAQTGRGTTSTGVIGVASFEEAVPAFTSNRVDRRLSRVLSATKGSPPTKGILRGAASASLSRGTPEAPELGTGYGRELSMATRQVEFKRASATPVVLTVRYGTREKLLQWGVPPELLDRPTVLSMAFPASVGPSVPAPPGWRG